MEVVEGCKLCNSCLVDEFDTGSLWFLYKQTDREGENEMKL